MIPTILLYLASCGDGCPAQKATNYPLNTVPLHDGRTAVFWDTTSHTLTIDTSAIAFVGTVIIDSSRLLMTIDKNNVITVYPENLFSAIASGRVKVAKP